MKTSEYWEKRALAREDYSRFLADKSLAERVLTAYERAAKQLTADVVRILRTYMKNGNLTEDEARKVLNSSEDRSYLDKLRKDLENITDPDIRRKALSRINAPAYAARISRIEALREKIYAEMSRAADEEIIQAKKVIEEAYEHTYYRSVFDTQKGTGHAFSFAKLSEKEIEAVLGESWSGEHYSKRVWRNTQLLAKRAESVITSGLISGKSISYMAQQIDETMKDGKYAAVRLVRTEANRAHNSAELSAYREEGVEKYRFLAVLDKYTCSLCGELDGNIYGVSEAVEGINYPPMHPNDRCTTVAHFDETGLENLQRRARDPVTGKNIKVPADMTFTEWKKQNQIEISKNSLLYMSKSFRPKFQTSKSISYKTVTGDKIQINVSRVSNSKFDLLTDDISATKAVKLVEKSLTNIRPLLPESFEMPTVALIDFKNNGLNSEAIGSYDWQTGIMYFNSKFNTSEKIVKYVSESKGLFANNTEYAPFLHELGHKYYEDSIKDIELSERVSYNKAKDIVDSKISNYVHKHSPDKSLSHSVSYYAQLGYNKHNYSEVVAECFSADDNDYATEMLTTLKE